METIGTITTLVLLFATVIGLVYLVYKKMVDYKTKVFKEEIVPYVIVALKDYTSDVMKKSLDATKEYMKDTFELDEQE